MAGDEKNVKVLLVTFSKGSFFGVLPRLAHQQLAVREIDFLDVTMHESGNVANLASDETSNTCCLR